MSLLAEAGWSPADSQTWSGRPCRQSPSPIPLSQNRAIFVCFGRKGWAGLVTSGLAGSMTAPEEPCVRPWVVVRTWIGRICGIHVCPGCRTAVLGRCPGLLPSGSAPAVTGARSLPSRPPSPSPPLLLYLSGSYLAFQPPTLWAPEAGWGAFPL